MKKTRVPRGNPFTRIGTCNSWWNDTKWQLRASTHSQRFCGWVLYQWLKGRLLTAAMHFCVFPPNQRFCGWVLYQLSHTPPTNVPLVIKCLGKIWSTGFVKRFFLLYQYYLPSLILNVTQGPTVILWCSPWCRPDYGQGSWILLAFLCNMVCLTFGSCL